MQVLEESIMNRLNELTIEIIQRCPNKCLHCSSLSSPTASQTIDSTRILYIAQQSIALGLKHICLSGGEPLLHPDLPFIIKGLGNLGLSIGFYTTGIEFDEKNETIPRTDWSLLPKESARIIFSLHSSIASTHDLLSGREGAFLLTKAAICAAIEQGYHVETHIVPNKMNLLELEETVRVVSSWGCKKISFLRLVPQGNAKKHISQLVLNSREEALLHRIGNRLKNDVLLRSYVRFGIPFSGTISQVKRCNAAESKLIIKYDGKILPCEAFKDDRFAAMILGDVARNSLQDALQAANNCAPLIQAKQTIWNEGCESCPAQFLYFSSNI